MASLMSGLSDRALIALEHSAAGGSREMAVVRVAAVMVRDRRSRNANAAARQNPRARAWGTPKRMRAKAVRRIARRTARLRAGIDFLPMRALFLANRGTNSCHPGPVSGRSRRRSRRFL
jgi:hypothetical protein